MEQEVLVAVLTVPRYPFLCLPLRKDVFSGCHSETKSISDLPLDVPMLQIWEQHVKGGHNFEYALQFRSVSVRVLPS